MPHNASGQDFPGYTPTSLDFINRPNPVEPHAAPPKHPLHGPPQLNQAYTQDLRRLLLDSVPRDASGEAASKRHKADDSGKARDLPKLPVRPAGPSNERRTRLPPTLSGLHQPPPNAGLLPSISVVQPSQLSGKASQDVASAPVGTTDGTLTETAKRTTQGEGSVNTSGFKAKPARRNKWSNDETESLLKGVARFGIGNWTKILNCEDYSFQRRTALDLKDRFRVCCPDQYAQGRPTQRGKQALQQKLNGGRMRVRRNDRKDPAELAELGLDKQMPKVERRSRHGYSAAEDAALLKGFEQYGKSWSSIQQDQSLDLAHRKPTDLRDRFRQRYPDQYAKAGLAPRPKVFPQPPDRLSKASAGQQQKSSSQGEQGDSGEMRRDSDVRTTEHRPKVVNQAQPDRSHQPQFLLADDVFFGLPAEDDQAESGPIVLDRGILDWGLYSSRKHSSAMLPPSSSLAAGLNATGGLPSLASITAASNDNDQLELPSMMHFFSSLEGDGRTGGSQAFPSLEELLNQA